jgi:dienelactone hydrolase
MKKLHHLLCSGYQASARLMMTILVCFAAFVSHNGQAQNIEYETKKIEYKDLVAKLYLPKTVGKVPAVIAFGGSDPSWALADANGEMMAKNGIAVIGAVYFKMDPSLPVSLDQIPMEYFIKAIDYAQTVPQIDANRIGVVSGSRGSEAGFLLGILDQRIKSVVITTPSKVAWGGMTSSKSAWTYQGKDIPSLSLPDIANATQLERFHLALSDQEKVKKAMFSFEKINGPILLVSAENDQIWPGTAMSNDIVAYLNQRKFAHSIIHKSYPTGHAFSRETAPEIKQMIIDHFIRTLRDQ